MTVCKTRLDPRAAMAVHDRRPVLERWGGNQWGEEWVAQPWTRPLFQRDAPPLKTDPTLEQFAQIHRREPMPRGTKVAKAETALKASAAKEGLKGRDAGRYVYGALNNIGLKSGNKTTARGAQKAARKR